jgi:hypothetical protein
VLILQRKSGSKDVIPRGRRVQGPRELRLAAPHMDGRLSAVVVRGRPVALTLVRGVATGALRIPLLVRVRFLFEDRSPKENRAGLVSQIAGADVDYGDGKGCSGWIRRPVES